MRKPRLALDAPEQVALKPQGEPLSAFVLSREHEHADAASLAVSRQFEPERADALAALLQSLDHLGQAGARLPPQKGEREVQVVAWDDSPAGEPCLPGDDAVQCILGKAQAEKEPDLLIALDLTGAGHSGSWRLCDKSLRSRWSDATVARRRIESRSCPYVNSIPRDASGVSPCT